MLARSATLLTNCILKQTPWEATRAGADTTKGDLIAMSHVTTWRPTALYTRIGCCTFPLNCAILTGNRKQSPRDASNIRGVSQHCKGVLSND